MTFIPNAGKMVMADWVSFSLDDIGGKRNNNCIVVGASGTTKTRSFVIPNILEATGSYIISASIIIQDVHQLESAYNEAWHTIISNCDNAMYLGGNDYETSVEISKQFMCHLMIYGVWNIEIVISIKGLKKQRS